MCNPKTVTDNTFDIKLEDHFKLYILLRDKITFESELRNNGIEFYSGQKEQPIIDGGIRYFLLNSDRPKIDQIIIKNEIIANTETITVSDHRDDKKVMKLYLYVAGIVIAIMILIGVIDRFF